MANIVIMPKQGLQMTEGLITKWLKNVGDEVKEGEPLFEMETDKLTITIDSSFTGTLLKIIRAEGEEVPITEPIAVIGEPDEDVSSVALSAESAEAPKTDAPVGGEGQPNVVIMPKQGLQMTEGLITKWLKNVGDEVKEGEPLFEMETDKLTITIDSSFTGTLLKIIRAEGEEVPITEPIALIGKPGDSTDGFTATVPAEEKQQEANSPAVPATPVTLPAKQPIPTAVAPLRAPGGRIFITPRAKMRCAERGITDYSKIPGTGGAGLIIERDVLAYKEPEKVTARASDRITVRADIGAAERYVRSAAEGGLDFDVDALIAKASASAAKKYPDFAELAVKTLCETDIEEYFPALPADKDALLSVGGIYSDGDRRLTVLSIVFDGDKVEASNAAAYLSRLKSLLENPLLMMAI